MLYTSGYKWVNGWHVSAPYWRGQQFQSSNNSVREKHVVSFFFNIFDSVLMFENVCEIHVWRIYQQLLNCKAIFIIINFRRKEIDRSNDFRSYFWFIFCSLYNFKTIYIIGILNFSNSPALLKDETLKITCVTIHWKK